MRRIYNRRVSRPKRRHKRQHRSHSRRSREPELLVHLAETLEERHPLNLLALASSYLEVSLPNPLDRVSGAVRTPVETLVQSFIDVDRRETTAILIAWSSMLEDPELVQIIERELGRRSHQLPLWLRELDRATVIRTVRVSDDFGDSENIMLDVVWPNRSMVFIALVDNNAGGAIKDGFPVDEAFDTVLDSYAEVPELRVEDVDPAWARAILAKGISYGRSMFPPLTSDTWPQSRPMLAWLTGLLPLGATLPRPAEPGDPSHQALADEFLESRFGAGFDREADVDALDLIITFAGLYGRADPLGWSPIVVDRLLNDWFPRKAVVDRDVGEAVPDVLEAFIRFAHAKRGVAPQSTEETIRFVDMLRPGFILEHGGLFDLDDIDEYMLGILAERVGGPDQLEALDTEPIPDEEFDWSGIEPNVAERVGEVLELVDRFAADRLDEEYRTIARRILAQAAVADPAIFRRKSKPEGGAAAVIWLAGKGSDLFDSITVKSLLEWFGLAPGYAVSSRAETIKKAIGYPEDPYTFPTHPYLGGPHMIHSSSRRKIIEAAGVYRRRIENR